MKIVAVLLLVSTAAFAKKNDAVYQDATLKSFRVVQSGQSCATYGNTEGSVNANTDSAGLTTGNVNATTNSTTSCSPRRIAQYTLVVGGQILVVEPGHSKKAAAGVLLTAGWGALALKSSSLAGQLPGAHVLIRSESGEIHIKAGKKESEFRIVSAE